MRLAYLYIIILLGSHSMVNGQTYLWDSWWRGEVTLEDGTLEKGMVNYDYESRTLIVRKEKSEKTYVAGNVYSFWVERIYEAKTVTKSKETYFSIYEENEYGYRMPSFYRALILGEVSVLLKGELLYQYSFDDPQFYIKNVPYLLFRDGRLERAKTWKKRLITQIEGDQRDLKRYIKKERLLLHDPVDLAKFIQFHNRNLSTLKNETRTL